MRVEGVVLEDHGHVSIFGGRIVDDAAPNADGAPGDIFQTGDHAEGSCLAASRRTYKDHGHVSIFGGRIVDDAAPNADGAPGDIFQTGDHAEGSCLAASRRTYKDHELAVLDLEIEIQDGDRAVGEDFGELIQLDLGHGSLLTL